MDQELKKALQDAFEAPAPKRKEAFLRSVPQPGISNLSFMISQAGYIRKRVWGISGVLFGVAYLGACVLGQDVMWVISALLPFAAVSVVSEHHRSYVFQMSELEMAARFSLKSVALARIGILGISHLLLLLFLIPACAVVPHVITFSDRTVSAGALSAERGCRIVGGAEGTGAGSHLCMCGDRSLRQRSQPAGTETVSSSLRDRVYPGLGSAAGRGRRMRSERMEMECEPAFGACLCVNP